MLSPVRRLGRPPAYSEYQKLRMFLSAVERHPWADEYLLRRVSGLYAGEFDRTQQQAVQDGLVEAAEIPQHGHRSRRRWGLTPRGAYFIGQMPTQNRDLHDALLRAVLLDPARQLMAEWYAAGIVVWSLSPVTLPAAWLRPEERFYAQHKTEVRDAALRSVRLSGLACIKLGEGSYLNLAILVDPGHIKFDWFVHQFRAMFAWRQTRPLRSWPRSAPVLMVIAADEYRRNQLRRLWRELTPPGEHPNRFRITTRRDLAAGPERIWLDGTGHKLQKWHRLISANEPSVMPMRGRYWSAIPCPEAEAVPDLGLPIEHGKRRPGLIRGSARRQGTAARLVRELLSLSAAERYLLEQIGRCPLITGADLAVILARRPGRIKDELVELE